MSFYDVLKVSRCNEKFLNADCFSFKKCRLHPNVTDGIAKHRFHTNEAKPAPMVQAFALLQMMELLFEIGDFSVHRHKAQIPILLYSFFSLQLL